LKHALRKLGVEEWLVSAFMSMSCHLRKEDNDYCKKWRVPEQQVHKENLEGECGQRLSVT